MMGLDLVGTAGIMAAVEVAVAVVFKETFAHVAPVVQEVHPQPGYWY